MELSASAETLGLGKTRAGTRQERKLAAFPALGVWIPSRTCTREVPPSCSLEKEIARARRQNSALSIATIHLEEFTELTQRDGLSAADQALKEFARRLKKACRGSDFAVRLSNDDFLLVLPECNLGEVKLVLNRIGAVEVNVSGRRVALQYTTGWVDYQAGDLPGDLLKRASQLLHLYDSAAKESFAFDFASPLSGVPPL